MVLCMGAAKVGARITVEAANEPAVNVEAVVEILLRDIFEFEEAAQKDPEQEQLNRGFPEYYRELIKPRWTLYRFTLSIKV